MCVRLMIKKTCINTVLSFLESKLNKKNGERIGKIERETYEAYLLTLRLD